MHNSNECSLCSTHAVSFYSGCDACVVSSCFWVKRCYYVLDLSLCGCSSSVESALMSHHICYFSQLPGATKKTTSLSHPLSVWWKSHYDSCGVRLSTLSYLKPYFWFSNYTIGNPGRLVSDWTHYRAQRNLAYFLTSWSATYTAYGFTFHQCNDWIITSLAPSACWNVFVKPFFLWYFFIFIAETVKFQRLQRRAE